MQDNRAKMPHYDLRTGFTTENICIGEKYLSLLQVIWKASWWYKKESYREHERCCKFYMLVTNVDLYRQQT